MVSNFVRGVVPKKNPGVSLFEVFLSQKEMCPIIFKTIFKTTF